METTLIHNRRARFDYEILEKFECGLALLGHEAKSLRKGQGHFNGTYISIRGGEAWLQHFHIPLYDKTTLENYNPERERKLLLHRKELDQIEEALSTEGYTLVPLDCGLHHQRLKMTIALVRGKKNYDKRESIKQRDVTRQIQRSLHDY